MLLNTQLYMQSPSCRKQKIKNINKTTANRPYVCLPTFHSKVCGKINEILVVFTIKKVYHIKINYRQ